MIKQTEFCICVLLTLITIILSVISAELGDISGHLSELVDKLRLLR